MGHWREEASRMLNLSSVNAYMRVCLYLCLLAVLLAASLFIWQQTVRHTGPKKSIQRCLDLTHIFSSKANGCVSEPMCVQRSLWTHLFGCDDLCVPIHSCVRGWVCVEKRTTCENTCAFIKACACLCVCVHVCVCLSGCWVNTSPSCCLTSLSLIVSDAELIKEQSWLSAVIRLATHTRQREATSLWH